MAHHRKPRLLRQGLPPYGPALFADRSPKVTANYSKPRGRQFFNNPGPTNIPDRVLRAMDRPVLDFMSDEFLAIHHACHAGVKRVLKTDQTLYMYNASGHGAWEAALANLFAAGDTVMIIETGYFSQSWTEMAVNLGIKVESIAADWRKGADISKLAERLAKDKAHEIRAVLTVHNETATGMVLPVADIRRAMDEAKHPALLLSDTISSLASIEYKMDAWGVDVTVGGSQKGLMLPTGMSLTGVSNKALDVSRKNKAPRHYWSWELMNGRAPQKFMGTAPVHMFFGLQESLKMLEEEGLAALQFGYHGDDARGLELRCHAQGRDRSLQPVAGRRAGTADGQGLPHRPSRRPERAHAAGLPRHHRARDEDRRRAVRAGRRRRRDRVALELAGGAPLEWRAASHERGGARGPPILSVEPCTRTAAKGV